jgi:hypothetical protein
VSSDIKSHSTDMVRKKRTITAQLPSQQAHTDEPVDDPGGERSLSPSQESEFPVDLGGAPEPARTPTLEAETAHGNEPSHEKVLPPERDEPEGAGRTPGPVQDRIPTRDTAEAGRRLRSPSQEKRPIPEPRVDKGKQPERRLDPLRMAPAESSTRGDPVIRIPEDGQTVVGLLRILKEELLKELRGDLSDLRGGVEAVQQGQVVAESFGRRLSNRVTAVTEEIHADMENLFGSMDALSSDLRGLWQGSYYRRERTRSSHFYGSEREPLPDPNAYDREDANWEPPQPPITPRQSLLGENEHPSPRPQERGQARVDAHRRISVNPLSGAVRDGRPEVTGRAGEVTHAKFRDETLERYLVMIRDRTGMNRDEVAEMKGVKVEPPEPYDGKDELPVWERWLDELLSYFYFYRVVGLALDRQWVLFIGTRLKGAAATWFHQEVVGPSIQSIKWTFEEVITGLFNHFLMEITAQKAVDEYEAVKFTRVKGVLGFWNEFAQVAERMANLPNNATLRRQFVELLPDELVHLMCRIHGVNVEISSAAELLEAARKVETSEHYISSRRKGGRVTAPTSATTSKLVEKSLPRVGSSSRFMRMQLFYQQREELRPPYKQKGESRPPPSREASRPAPASAGPSNWKKPVPAAGNTNTAKVVCYNCHRTGHYSNNCPHPHQGTDTKTTGVHAKSRTYALRVEAAPEEQGTERGDGATADALDEQDTLELQEPSSSEDDEQFEGGSEEDVFILEDWEEGEEPPLEPEETLNAM